MDIGFRSHYLPVYVTEHLFIVPDKANQDRLCHHPYRNTLQLKYPVTTLTTIPCSLNTWTSFFIVQTVTHSRH